MKQCIYMYTIVCRYYTIDGIFEIDLYDVIARLHTNDDFVSTYGMSSNIYNIVRHHVYSGEAVEYKIKKVVRNFKITEDNKMYYSYHSPYSILYDCMYDLKDIERVNYESIWVRRNMTDGDFYRIYGGNKHGG